MSINQPSETERIHREREINGEGWVVRDFPFSPKIRTTNRICGERPRKGKGKDTKSGMATARIVDCDPGGPCKAWAQTPGGQAGPVCARGAKWAGQPTSGLNQEGSPEDEWGCR